MIFKELNANDFIDKLEHNETLLFPIKKDNKHSLISEVVAIICYDIHNKEYYVYNISHPDLQHQNDISILRLVIPNNCLCLDSRILFKYVQLYDMELYYWFYTNEKISFNYSLLRHYTNIDKNSIGKAVPIQKWLEFFQEIVQLFLPVYVGVDNSFSSYSKLVYEELIKVESNGIALCENMVQKRNIEVYDSLFFSNYNLLTTTGRPSNSRSRFNLSAIPKEDGSRQIIKSRFEDGWLLDFDFKAYHIFLIANIIKYKFKDIDIHTYFGKQYFNKDVISNQEYDESKQITFKQLYSEDLTYKIPFFEKVGVFKNTLWEYWNEKGYIKLPNTRKKISKQHYPNITKSKLFNYLLQGIETEQSMLKLKKLNIFLEDKNSCVVLYVYDSFVIDFDPIDGKDTIKEIKNILEEDNFPTSLKMGRDYHNMKKVNF